MTSRARPDDPLYVFGGFLADPVQVRLSRHGQDVPLTRKCFQVLEVLLERQGEVASKDELLAAVWPDTFVEENNLARTVSMLRKALHEHGDTLECIATVPGRGYRIAVPVARLTRDGMADAGGEPRAATWPAPVAVLPAAQRRSAYLYVSAAVVAMVALIGAAGLWSRSASGSAAAGGTRLWKLTSAGLLEGEPTWSPDGRLVAYSSDRSGNFDIWMQALDGVEPVQVTSDSARDWQPAWSPAGEFLAYRSERDGGGLYLRSTANGQDRRLTDFGYRPQWSPDGHSILFHAAATDVGVNARTLYLVDVATGVITEALPASIRQELEGVRAAWHPDGRLSIHGRHPTRGLRFATFRRTGDTAMQWSTIDDLVAGRLEQAGVSLGSFAWAPDATALYFEGTSDQVENIWRVTVDRETLAWIGGPTRLTVGSGREKYLALSPDGRRLAFGSRAERTQVWSLPFDPVAGRILGDGEPMTLPGSDAYVLDLSMDGRLTYRTTRANRDELWIQGPDRRDSIIRTEADMSISQPRWSRDGHQLAYFTRSTDGSRGGRVVLVDTKSGAAQPLATAHTLNNVFEWAADGSAVLVGCRPDAHPYSAICLAPVHGEAPAAPHVVAIDRERNLWQARSSSDGGWVSFIAVAPGMSASTVFAMSTRSGEWVPVTDGQHYDDKPRWTPDGRTIYFLSHRRGFWNLWGQRFDPVAGRPVGKPFQVSDFTSARRFVSHRSQLQIGLTRDHVVLPLTETSGAVWVLDGIDQLAP